MTYFQKTLSLERSFNNLLSVTLFFFSTLENITTKVKSFCLKRGIFITNLNHFAFRCFFPKKKNKASFFSPVTCLFFFFTNSIDFEWQIKGTLYGTNIFYLFFLLLFPSKSHLCHSFFFFVKIRVFSDVKKKQWQKKNNFFVFFPFFFSTWVFYLLFKEKTIKLK